MPRVAFDEREQVIISLGADASWRESELSRSGLSVGGTRDHTLLESGVNRLVSDRRC
jgi:hypothetical protein